MRALLVLPLIVYLLLPTRNYYWDGVSMAVDIEKHAPVLYPSHLIYGLVGSWMYHGALALGIKTRALFLMQGLNAVLGGLCAPLFYRVLRRSGIAVHASIAGALVFAFSATWWKFATDADAYVPSIFFLLCAYLLIEDGHAIPGALAHAMAMLFHELAIFFLPVAWILLRNRRRQMTEYAACALAPVIGAYMIACQSVFGDFTPRHLLSWATAHSPDSGFYFNPLRDAALTLRGTLRLILGGRLDQLSGDLVSKIALAGLAISAVIFLIAIARGRHAAKWSGVPLPFVCWTALYLAFLFFWMPQNTFYRLFYLAPLIAMAIFSWRGAPVLRLVPVLLLWNFALLIYPESQPRNNAPLKFALAQRDRWPAGTPIVYSDFHPDLWTISYFVPGTAWIGLDRADIAALDRDLDYARGQHQPLWVETDAYHMIASSTEGRAWLAAHDRTAERIEYKDSRHDFRFYCER